jgi:hypothetical protein
MMEEAGPHDSAIGRYLDELGIVVEPHPDSLRRRRTLEFVLSQEVEKLEGESYVLADDADKPTGIALVGPAIGLTIVSLEMGSKVIAVRAFGHLTSAVLSKTGPADDGDMETPFRLTIEHDRLPASLIHEARSKSDLERAYDAFTTAFRP